MKKLYSLFFLFTVNTIVIAQQQWTWIGGDKSSDLKGIYGSQGVFSPSNIPGSRAGAATWTDKNGNFWLFGGMGKDENGRTGWLNDLWKFNPSSKQWTWVGGPKVINKNGKYGTKGMSSEPANPAQGRMPQYGPTAMEIFGCLPV